MRDANINSTAEGGNQLLLSAEMKGKAVTNNRAELENF
jgi:hypothetical protein